MVNQHGHLVSFRYLDPLVLLFITASFSSTLNADVQIEAAGGLYDDDVVQAYLSSQSLSYQTASIAPGSGTKSGIKLGLTEKRTTYKDEGSLFVKDQLEGDPTTTDQAVTVSLDQGIAVGTRLGLSSGMTKSKLGGSHFFGARAGQWWLKETLETTLEVRRTTADQKPSSGTDFDGQRVVLPENLEGYNLSIGLTSFVTTSTIFTSNLSYTTRNDRPPAESAAVEIRQYFSATKSALHVGGSHYENVGSLDPVTFTGEILANSFYAEWHQRILSRAILMGGYRYYVETEKPRAEGADVKQLGTDSVYATLRYRDSEVGWTQEASEVYLFGSIYSTNAPQRGQLLGLGGRLVW